ncbi:MAG: DUF5683 domain-containing protein [Sphingobacterium sp.]
MYKLILLVSLLLSVFCSYGQVKDTIPPDSTKLDPTADSVQLQNNLPDTTLRLQDTTLQDTAQQDTAKEETRAERRAREKAEKEREKYYYKDILKDSARLEIERLSRVAWKRSLILPGWGQYTNGGVWWIKVPVIYGGFVASVLVFDYWQWYYKMFLGELQHREEHGQGSEGILGINSNWTVQGLVQQKDYGRRNRDLTIVLTLGWYGLNVVEAYVDSILKNRWNVSNDLSMKVSPTFLPNYAYTPGMAGFSARGLVTPGLKLTFTLK